MNENDRTRLPPYFLHCEACKLVFAWAKQLEEPEHCPNRSCPDRLVDALASDGRVWLGFEDLDDVELCPSCTGQGGKLSSYAPRVEGGAGVEEVWHVCTECKGSGLTLSGGR